MIDKQTPAAAFLVAELRRVRTHRGLSQEELGKTINYSGSLVSAVELGQQRPSRDFLARVDAALDTGGMFTRMLTELVAVDTAPPPWLREWITIERAAIALRWYEPTFVPGLLQTEAYARATLAAARLSPAEVDQRVASRLARQAVLAAERPPRFVAVVDELVLRRPLRRHPGVLAEQLEHLINLAERPHIEVHVVPTDVGLYPGLQGGFVLAELADGGLVGHADSQVSAHVVDRADDIGSLNWTWETIRGEALSRRQSLELIKEAASQWT